MPRVYFVPDKMCTMLKLEIKRVHDFFVANGWEVTTSPESADKILCSVCVGWDNLEQESLDALDALAGFGDKVAAIGCVNAIDERRVDAVHRGSRIPSDRMSAAAELIPDAAVRFEDVPEPSTFRSREDYRLYDLTKRYVNIAYGCSFSCSYCLHKVGIGPRRSRPVADIVAQVDELRRGGVRVVVLTGMETGLYGRDLDTDFAALLRAVLALDAEFDVHIAQHHPSGLLHFEDQYVELLSNPRVTDLQLPIQTTSERLLALMNRPPLPPRLADVLRAVALRNPRLVLRTDLIVGFPGETWSEFQDAVAFAADIFDEIAVYRFERKTGLAAERMDEGLGPDEIDRRRDYALETIAASGKLAHNGQQATMDLNELERRRVAQRAAKAAAAGCRLREPLGA